MDDETLVTRPAAPPAEPPMTSEAELSRIAREAVRQPADPRLDRQLAKMGLADEPGAAVRRSSQSTDAVALSNATERIARLEGRVRRLEIAFFVALVIVAAVLVVRTSG